MEAPQGDQAKLSGGQSVTLLAGNPLDGHEYGVAKNGSMPPCNGLRQ